VLQWGYNGSFGASNGWSLASWYCSNTQCPHSTPTTTASGDKITASFYMAGGNTWSIFVQDDYNTQNYSWLETNPTIGPFNTVQGGVLEDYNVTNCNQIPDASIVFWNQIWQQDGPVGTYTEVFPTFSTYVGTNPNQNPNCGSSASSSVYTYNGTTYSISNIAF
jgi:hypothetical protein